MGGALAVLVLVGILAPIATSSSPAMQRSGDRLADVRVLLEENTGNERILAKAMAHLEEADVPAALEALTSWPPELALQLERGLVEDRRLRGALLEAACRDLKQVEARRLLVQQFHRLVARSEPFTRGEYGRLDRVRDVAKLSPQGVLIRWLCPPGTTMPVAEFLRLLEEAAVTAVPLVVWPGVLDEVPPLEGPVPVQAAEWLLHGTLAHRGLVPVRLLRATWILPQATLETEAWKQEEPTHDDSERTVRERLRRREARLLDAALAELTCRPGPRRVLEAAELLAAVGLPCPVPPPDRMDARSRARLLVAALHRDPSIADRPLEAGPEEWWDPVWLRARLALGRVEAEPMSGFLRARVHPGSCQERAMLWLRGDEREASVDVIAGLSAALRQDPEGSRRAVLAGRLPYGSGPDATTAPVTGTGEPQLPDEDGATLLRTAWCRRAGTLAEASGLDRDLAALLESDQASRRLVQMLARESPSRSTLRDVLVVEASGPGIRALLVESVQAAREGELDVASCRRALRTVRDVVAAHAIRDPLLASWCARLPVYDELEEGSALALLCQEFSDSFRLLDWWTPAEGEWLVALDELGWVSAGSR